MGPHMAVILEVVDDHRAVVELQNGVRWTLPMPERTALAVGMKVCVMDTGEKLIVAAGLIEAKVVDVVDNKHAVVEFETGRQLTLRMPEHLVRCGDEGVRNRHDGVPDRRHAVGVAPTLDRPSCSGPLLLSATTE